MVDDLPTYSHRRLSRNNSQRHQWFSNEPPIDMLSGTPRGSQSYRLHPPPKDEVPYKYSQTSNISGSDSSAGGHQNIPIRITNSSSPQFSRSSHRSNDSAYFRYMGHHRRSIKRSVDGTNTGYSSIKDIFIDFCMRTSSHGIPFIGYRLTLNLADDNE